MSRIPVTTNVPPNGIVATLPFVNWLFKFQLNESKSPLAVIVVSAPAQIAGFPSIVSSGGGTSSTLMYIVTDVVDDGEPSSTAEISMLFRPGEFATNVPVIPAFVPSV